ncbi:MAG: site-specific DNA-methyltransferase [Actinobacteria bacterium]|nr:site-specific DNA-methyltransferase [Actinomycetota bacterium]
MSDPDAATLDAFIGVVAESLDRDGVVVLEPLDVEHTLALWARIDTNCSTDVTDGLAATCVMLDPWYNKGVGGVRDDYIAYVVGLLTAAGQVAPHVYLWGFPEIIAGFVDRLPEGLTLEAWLTWYYKNSPSVIRGWRSAQMTCLHLRRADGVMHPEAFLNEAQLAKQAAGKLRYLPGPPSVIEAGLLVGFIGRNEQTGHPSQKPQKVYDPLVRMATVAGELVLDPMCGSGTTGAVARATGRRAVLADVSDEYVAMVEERLGIERVAVPRSLVTC